MFTIKDNILKITKGDTGRLKVDLKLSDGSEYIMKSGDTLTLTVRKRPNSSIMMQVTSTTNVLTMTPDKTSELEAGACCYDVELKTSDGDVFTVVGLTDYVSTNMYVFGEVTY